MVPTTYEDARVTNFDEGWAYELAQRQSRIAKRVESVHLSEEQLSVAWLTANRRVDNDAERYV